MESIHHPNQTSASGGSWTGTHVSVLALLLVLSAVLLLDNGAHAQAGQPERELVPNLEPGRSIKYLAMFSSEADMTERRSV